ncbi:MAG: hypothetical protein QNJ72_12645 [Pleurocapsa sp. MO_226.B13]|nr:hypothetical protein [Pleurocapsa sp. MO_226.B13]
MTEQSYSEQTIGNLTKGQLEEIIKQIAQKTIKQEMIDVQENKVQALAATFGNWENERTEEEIIKDIYDSRNSNLTSI